MQRAIYNFKKFSIEFPSNLPRSYCLINVRYSKTEEWKFAKLASPKLRRKIKSQRDNFKFWI